ncbi:MAG: carboxypeptidase-like regulatory domain-containing protein, partial [Ginsengibacter sp.]
MKSKFYFFLMLLFSFTTVMSQSRTVTGTVRSEAGEALLGVTVAVKGTKTVTATDASGKYSIQVPSGNPVLTFSYVGSKTQTIPVENRSVVNVSLSLTASTLNDVVVVGYG